MNKIRLGVFLVFLAFIVCKPMFSQQKTVPPLKGMEWWETRGECEKATNFVYYSPRTSKPEPKIPGLRKAGLPHQACVYTRLPELKRDGWVRQMQGTLYWSMNESNDSIKPMFMVGCVNEVLDFFYLPDPVGPPGIPGEKGDTGIQGPPGPPGEKGEPGGVVQTTTTTQPQCVACCPDCRPVPKAEAAPPKKSWIKRHWKELLVVGVLAAAAGGGYAGARGGKPETVEPVVVKPVKNPVIIISTGP